MNTLSADRFDFSASTVKLRVLIAGERERKRKWRERKREEECTMCNYRSAYVSLMWRREARRKKENRERA